MIKVYISGAITGVEDYKARFEKAENELRAGGFIPVNPAKMEALPIECGYEEIMDVDILLLSKCDSIYMLRGWRDSRGANREYGYALGKEMPIMYEEENK